MNRIKKGKILYKFLLFVLPFVILSIILTSAVLSWTSYTYFRKTIDQDYRNILKSSAGEIRLFVKDAQKNLQGLSWVIAATKLDRWRKDMALTAFNHQMEEFLSVSLISNQGQTVATTRWDEKEGLSDQKELLKKVLSGESAVSNVMLTEDRLPFIHMVVPLFHLGEVKEILWGELNLKSVWDILEGIKIGRSGQVYIMDHSGRYIAHREIDRVVAPPPVKKPQILKTISASLVPVSWEEVENGTSYYCLGSYVPDFDWVIVLRQPLPEIYTYLYQNVFGAIMITILLCLAAAFIGWRRIKRFLRPIQSLHRQVLRIGAGGLDHKVAIDSRDEIGDLGLAFNQMTDSLKEYIQREIETAKELVHAKNLAVLGTTSSKVTHEVGNLLNNIGMTLTALKRETLSQMGHKSLQILENESTRIRTFITHFLQFAKKPELRLSKIKLDLVIKEVLAAQQPEAKRKGIEIELNWPPHIAPINADMNLMYQVINNLIKNSLEATNDTGKICIEGKTEATHLKVAIADSGSGIEPEILEKIFDPFFSTKGKKGTGLGMSIVKTIVEAHRGTIECTSVIGEGATFVLNLPLN